MAIKIIDRLAPAGDFKIVNAGDIGTDSSHQFVTQAEKNIINNIAPSGVSIRYIESDSPVTIPTDKEIVYIRYQNFHSGSELVQTLPNLDALINGTIVFVDNVDFNPDHYVKLIPGSSGQQVGGASYYKIPGARTTAMMIANKEVDNWADILVSFRSPYRFVNINTHEVFSDIQTMSFGGGFTVEQDESDDHVLIITNGNQANLVVEQEDGQGDSVGSCTNIKFSGATVAVDPVDAAAAVVTVTPATPGISGIDVDDGATTISDATGISFTGATVGGASGGTATVNITSTNQGITVRDEVGQATGITDLQFVGGELTSSPPQASFKIPTDWSTHGNPTASGKGHKVSVRNNLQVYSDPNVTDGVILEVKPGSYELMHAPGFLAYLKDEEEVIGQMDDDYEYHKGGVWFDDIRVLGNPYIATDRVNKTYGIQEWDDKDPNITGGNNFIVAFIAHFKGTAPTNGTIRIALVNKDAKPGDPDKGFFKDVNDNVMVAETHYKADAKLEPLLLTGIVNAKGLKEFGCVVSSTFDQGDVVLEDPTEGPTGLLIQAIGVDRQASVALSTFELDNDISITWSSHYLGVDRMMLSPYLRVDQPVVSYTAGTHAIANDGWRVINTNGLKSGVQSGHLIIQDDGVNICDFNAGMIFSAEETVMLRGKQEKVTVTLTDKQNGYTAALMKWTGKPDEYTKTIYTSRSNGTPIWETNWSQVDTLFISEDVVSGDHTVDKTFTIPSDANNYALILYPTTAQKPIALKLKEFKSDVVTPFIGYVEHYPEWGYEKHLVFSEEHKSFKQDNQGYASLRYTINNTPANGLPMPCGIPDKGTADITIDTSVNQVSGSGAKGGEGAITFNADGEAYIATTLRISNEQISASNTTFWWANVSPDGGTYTKIDDSESTFTVPAKSANGIFKMKPFRLTNIEQGSRIALRALTDSVDGAFIQSNSPKAPMVDVDIQFSKLVEDSGDDPDAVLDVTRAAREAAGDTIYTASLCGSANFTEASYANIIFTDLPSGAMPHCIGAYKTLGNGIIKATVKMEEQFNPSTSTLTVSFGESVAAKVFYEVRA